MNIYYYTNRDKLDDRKIPDFLECKGYSVLIDFVRPEIDWLKQNKIQFIISDRARYIIDESVINFMKCKIINLHPSFLPWCKGYHPILAGLIKNQCLGVTLHLINKGIDTGDILIQEPIYIAPNDTLSTLYDKHRSALFRLLQENLDLLLNGKIAPVAQHPLMGSFHKKDQFPAIISKLPYEWDTSVTWIKENFMANEVLYEH